MSYNPVIKNLPALITDLQRVQDGEFPVAELMKKINYNQYEYDSTDGFEDILDSISPFIKELTKVASIPEDQIAKNKLAELIKRLKDENSLKDLEEIR